MTSSKSQPVIVWFRQDLRLTDNPALLAARDTGRPVLPVYVLDDHAPGRWKPGGASRWWLHHSLKSLAADLESAGAPLRLIRASALKALPELADKIDAAGVYWNRCYEPWARERDEKIKNRLKDAGVDARSFNGSLLAEPWEIKTGGGAPYKVYTPFFKALAGSGFSDEPAQAVRSLDGVDGGPKSESLDDWDLLPEKPNWAKGFEDEWTPGESGAKAALSGFLRGTVGSYADARDKPGETGTSRLSPHLHHGEISPRQVWAATKERAGSGKGPETFLKEIGWREFSYHLLYNFPQIVEDNFQEKFDKFPWKDNDVAFAKWKRGQTGYPIVDAGMRQLWAIGWMHNRVRMVAASFLIKHLLIDWRRGEDWFWDTLVDADLASNSASWQWVAGSGADAAPYFRIFNPVTQGEKFDPEGDYVRAWVPELKDLPAKYIHQPWTAPREVLSKAGVTLGKDYPEPLVDHKQARQRALDAFDQIKGAA